MPASCALFTLLLAPCTCVRVYLSTSSSSWTFVCTWSHPGGGQSLTALLHEVVSCSLHVFQRDHERVNVCTYSMCCLCNIRLFANVVCHVDVDVMLEEQCVSVVRIMLYLIITAKTTLKTLPRYKLLLSPLVWPLAIVARRSWPRLKLRSSASGSEVRE